MIRIEQGTARALLSFIYNYMDDQVRANFDALLREHDSGQTISSLARSIEDQTENGGYPEGPLVDTIVDILQNDYARNTLSGNTYSLLKNAVLLPSERTALTEKIKKGFSCSACGSPLVNNEMTTIDLHASRGITVTCIRCKFPVKIACDKYRCEEKADVPKTLGKILEKGHDCGTHDGKVKDVVIEADPLAAQMREWGAIIDQNRGGVAAAPRMRANPIQFVPEPPVWER